MGKANRVQAIGFFPIPRKQNQLMVSVVCTPATDQTPTE